VKILCITYFSKSVSLFIHINILSHLSSRVFLEFCKFTRKYLNRNRRRGTADVHELFKLQSVVVGCAFAMM
jgi:hypothetical protein